MIIITGPTASGKTALADMISQKFKTRLINADVAQMYTAFEVGTAKPTNIETRGHLFDICDKPEDINVFQYRELVKEEIKKARDLQEEAVIVGGSLFYIKNLLFKTFSAEDLQSFYGEDSIIMNQPLLELIQKMSKREIEELEATRAYDYLYQIDQVRAVKIGAKDAYRLQRALLVAKQSGLKPSSLVAQFSPVVRDEPITIIFVNPSMTDLSHRIAKRTQEMLQLMNQQIKTSPWMKEVLSIKGTEWESFARKKGFIGYKELLEWCEKEENKEEEPFLRVVQKIIIRTRDYGKRQICFWKGLHRQLCTVDIQKQVKVIEIKSPNDLTINDFKNMKLKEI